MCEVVSKKIDGVNKDSRIMLEFVAISPPVDLPFLVLNASNPSCQDFANTINYCISSS